MCFAAFSIPSSPCSGVKSATRLTSPARCRTVRVRVPRESQLVWLVISPTRLPRKAAYPDSLKTSIPSSNPRLEPTEDPLGNRVAVYAIANPAGVWIKDLPITPEKILKAIREQQGMETPPIGAARD